MLCAWVITWRCPRVVGQTFLMRSVQTFLLCCMISQPGAFSGRGRLWAGNVIQSLAHGWKDTWLIFFPSCVAWYKVSSRDKSVTLGREVCMGNCLLPFQQGLGPPWQWFLGRGMLAASSPQPVLLPLRKKGLSLILIIPKSGCEWQPRCKAVMTQALWSLYNSGFVNASKITVV